MFALFALMAALSCSAIASEFGDDEFDAFGFSFSENLSSDFIVLLSIVISHRSGMSIFVW